MLRRVARYAVWLGMVAVAIVLVIDLLYLWHGSLEDFPTAEQQDKVRRVTAAGALLLLSIEAILWLIARAISSAGASPSPTAPSTSGRRAEGS